MSQSHEMQAASAVVREALVAFTRILVQLLEMGDREREEWLQLLIDHADPAIIAEARSGDFNEELDNFAERFRQRAVRGSSKQNN